MRAASRSASRRTGRNEAERWELRLSVLRDIEARERDASLKGGERTVTIIDIEKVSEGLKAALSEASININLHAGVEFTNGRRPGVRLKGALR
jgi:hypothetical protein